MGGFFYSPLRREKKSLTQRFGECWIIICETLCLRAFVVNISNKKEDAHFHETSS